MDPFPAARSTDAHARTDIPSSRDRDEPAAQRAMGACRILVVDDNRDGGETLGKVLSLMGADVRVVYDGASALHTLRAFAPDVVLLDIEMPGMDGYELARAIRHDTRNAGVRLIALTGWGTEDVARRAETAGCDVLWVKPVSPEALRDLARGTPGGCR